MGCKTAKSFIFGGEFSIYELILKLIEKLNEVIDYVNTKFIEFQAQLNLKEYSQIITTSRKLSPNGDFTGTIQGKSSMTIITELDANTDQIDYLIDQFSDGQTGFVIDGGFFEETGIAKNYNGGVF